VRAGLPKTAPNEPENGDRRPGKERDEAAEPQAEQPPAENGERDAEHDRAAAVGTEVVVGHHQQTEQTEEEEAQRAEAPPGKRGSGEERREEKRLQLVADSPE